MNPITPDPFRGVGGAFVRDPLTGRRQPATAAATAPAAVPADPPAVEPDVPPPTVPAVPADDDPEL